VLESSSPEAITGHIIAYVAAPSRVTHLPRQDMYHDYPAFSISRLVSQFGLKAPYIGRISRFHPDAIAAFKVNVV
jgi:hypothetical protein